MRKIIILIIAISLFSLISCKENNILSTELKEENKTWTQAIEKNNYKIGNLSNSFKKDDESIYYKAPIADLKIEGADPNTFGVITGRLARDKSNLYLTHKILASFAKKENGKLPDWTNKIDVDSFRPLGDSEIGYMKDKNSIYYIDCYWMGDCNLDLDIIDSKSPENFRLLMGKDNNGDIKNYATDDQNVYKRGDLLKGIDAKTFEILNDTYLKDKKHIYYETCKGNCHNSPPSILEEADLGSFEVLSNWFSKDKNNCYESWKIVEMSECNKIKNNIN